MDQQCHQHITGDCPVVYVKFVVNFIHCLMVFVMFILLYRASIFFRTKIKPHHLDLIDAFLREDPTLTSPDLADKLRADTGLSISASVVRKVRIKLGWTFTRTKYCQLIR